MIDPFDLSDPTEYPALLERQRKEIERLRIEIEKLNSIIMEYGDHFAALERTHD